MRDVSAVTCERIGRIALLRLNAAEQGDTLSAPVLDGLSIELASLAVDPQVRAVVLTGAGRNFSLGGDLDELVETVTDDAQFGRAYCAARMSALSAVIACINEFPWPVIAAVNGQAAGAGFSLALACDIRIAEDHTRFYFAYGALGASTDGGMSWLLPRIVGVGMATALLLEQPVIRAAKALAMGLLSDVVPSGELIARAVAYASLLASNSSHANLTTKRLLRTAQFTTLREHMREEHLAFADGLMSGDMRHALVCRQRGELPTFD